MQTEKVRKPAAAAVVNLVTFHFRKRMSEENSELPTGHLVVEAVCRPLIAGLFILFNG